MYTLSAILLCWSACCLLLVLFMMAASRNHLATPKPEPNPTFEQVNGVMEVYEILGMYEGPIQ